MAHVEAQLHGGGELVDVLAARPRRANEGFGNLAVVDADGVVDADHEALGMGLTGDIGNTFPVSFGAPGRLITTPCLGRRNSDAPCGFAIDPLGGAGRRGAASFFFSKNNPMQSRFAEVTWYQTTSPS